MRPLLLSALLVISAPAFAQDEPDHRWFLYGASGGGGRMIDGGSPGGVSHAGLRFHLKRSLWGEAQTGEGYFERPQETIGRIGFGLRVEPPRDGFRPSVYVGFAHAHEVDFTTATRKPLPVAFGTHHALRHRTGVEAGLALTSPEIPLHLSPRSLPPLRVFLRVQTTAYADREPTPVYVIGDVGVGLAF